MMLRGLLILGFGGHARSVGDIAIRAGFTNLYFIDENASPNETLYGFKASPVFPDGLTSAWDAFPAAGNNQRRMEQISLLRERGFTITTLISPTAYIGLDAKLMPGTIVAHHTHIGPMVTIGEGCILNTGAIIEHECQVGHYSHISVNATIAGRCKVGDRVFIGAGAVVIDNINIGDDVIIGAGATVVEDIMKPGTYVGTPARPVKLI